MLRLENISQVFRTEEVETTAIQGVNLEINRGEFVSIMGPSGSGKSSMLNILGLLASPTSGRYYFLDEEVSLYPEKKLAQIRKANIGYIFQEFNLIDELTVFENVELSLLYQGRAKNERKRLVQEILIEVGLSHREKHYPKQLSGGQQQRVAIARALVSNPKLILADEPTGNLDSAMGKEVMEMLKSLNSKGTTLVMVTHSLSHSKYANRVLHLLDGKLEESRIKHVSVENTLDKEVSCF